MGMHVCGVLRHVLACLDMPCTCLRDLNVLRTVPVKLSECV